MAGRPGGPRRRPGPAGGPTSARSPPARSSPRDAPGRPALRDAVALPAGLTPLAGSDGNPRAGVAQTRGPDSSTVLEPRTVLTADARVPAGVVAGRPAADQVLGAARPAPGTGNHGWGTAVDRCGGSSRAPARGSPG